MDDRRAQLLRQRAAIAQHLAWLDAEIAATAEAPPLAASPPPTVLSPASMADEPSPADFASPPSPELSKRGCWIIFFVATTLLVAGGLVAVYSIYR